MFVPYDQLADDSKVWIYFSNRVLSDTEVSEINPKVEAFCDKWEAHKQPVKAWGGIKDNLFLVLAADENFHGVSGCSIDSSVHFIKALEEHFGISFFDRTKVPVKIGRGWRLLSQKEIKDQIAGGEISAETLIFNHKISNKHEFEHCFEIPVSDSWLVRLLPQLR